MSFFSKIVDDFKKGFNEGFNKGNEGKKVNEESGEISLDNSASFIGAPSLEDSIPLEPSEQLPALRPTGEVAKSGETNPKGVWSTFVAGTKDVFNKVTEIVGSAYTEWTDKLTPSEIASAEILDDLPAVYKERPLEYHPADEFNDQERQAFVVRMSEYFRKRPRFKIDESMLNSMEVLFSQRHVVNHIHLSTLFESRTFSCGCKAYEDEATPNSASVDRSNVNPWNVEFEPRRSFKNRQSTVMVFDSLRTDRCGGCNGHAMCICSICNGNGEYRCDSCAGKGEKRCDSCGGTGYDTGRLQLAPGMASPPDHRCSSCSGSGFSRCFWCWGSGVRSCMYCGGKGKTVCSDCKGSGNQLFYVEVTQTLKGTSKSAFIPNGDVSLNVFKKLKHKIDTQEVKRLEINSIASEEVPPWFGGQFSGGNDFLIQELNTWFNEFCRSVGKDDSLNVNRLAIIVSQTVVNHVRYSLGNGRYDIWLFGREQKPFEAMNPMKG